MGRDCCYDPCSDNRGKRGRDGKTGAQGPPGVAGSSVSVGNQLFAYADVGGTVATTRAPLVFDVSVGTALTSGGTLYTVPAGMGGTYQVDVNLQVSIALTAGAPTATTYSLILEATDTAGAQYAGNSTAITRSTSSSVTTLVDTISLSFQIVFAAGDTLKIYAQAENTTNIAAGGQTYGTITVDSIATNGTNLSIRRIIAA